MRAARQAGPRVGAVSKAETGAGAPVAGESAAGPWSWSWIEGGVAAPAGFRAIGVACGLKRDEKLDFAIVRSDPPAAAAAIFTTNVVKAAPVLYDQEVLRAGRPVSLVVANSKVANACTGDEGLRAARETAAAALAETGASGAALVLSTGIIGRQLDMERIRTGIRLAVAGLGPFAIADTAAQSGRRARGADDAAQAILTTDTFAKAAALRVTLHGGASFTIGGMAKGAGMIHPDMATMLAVLTTDAAVERSALQAALRHAADRSFHALSVDGDTSTNDTVLLLANGRAAPGGEGHRATNGSPARAARLNGAAGAVSLVEGGPGYVAFREALTILCIRLARWIAADGEGARRLIEIRVAGAATDAAARAIGRVIATSPLVKTALGAADANWGRIAAAAGRSGQAVDPEALGVGFASSHGSVEVLRDGAPLEHSEAEAARILAADEVQVTVVVGCGPGTADVWTCDLSEAYVRINSAYRT
jgi:glutamate N-acetyltransferase/amino-acid N-acetyltransferase